LAVFFTEGASAAVPSPSQPPRDTPKEKSPEPSPEVAVEKPAEVVEDDDDIIMEEPPERHFELVTVEDSDEEMYETADGEEEGAKVRRSLSSVSEDVVESRVIFRNVVELEPDARMDTYVHIISSSFCLFYGCVGSCDFPSCL
jgi:hypothetical protein